MSNQNKIEKNTSFDPPSSIACEKYTILQSRRGGIHFLPIPHELFAIIKNNLQKKEAAIWI